MKRAIAAICALALMLACAAAQAQEFFTLPEIREQAAQGWHETYTDKYGRTRQVDIDIEVFGEETAPVIEACWGEPQIASFEGSSPHTAIQNARLSGKGVSTYPYESVRGMKVNPDEKYAEEYGNDLTVGEMYAFIQELLQEQGVEQEYAWERPYVIYSNPDEEWGKQGSAYDMDTWYLVPSWVMECYILEDPKVDQLKEYSPVREMTINAQTGKMMDYFDTSLYGRGDARYDQWLGENAGISQRDILRMTIDAALRMRPDGFDALMQILEEAGCRIKRAAQISIRPPGGKRFIRLDTLEPEYTEAALEASLSGQRVHIPKRSRTQYTRKQIELLIDIEAKLRTGKGKGYERWAEKHNIDTLARSMIYLKENHIGSYADLTQKIQLALDSRNGLKDEIREAQRRMQEISAQRKAIWIYRQTRDVYTKYKESGWASAFYRKNKEAIEAHKQAQAVYSAADGKLPTLSELSQEYDRLLVQKREVGQLLAQRNEELQSLRHIKKNLDTLLADEHFVLEQPFENEKKPREYDQRPEKTGR